MKLIEPRIEILLPKVSITLVKLAIPQIGVFNFRKTPLEASTFSINLGKSRFRNESLLCFIYCLYIKTSSLKRLWDLHWEWKMKPSPRRTRSFGRVISVARFWDSTAFYEEYKTREKWSFAGKVFFCIFWALRECCRQIYSRVVPTQSLKWVVRFSSNDHLYLFGLLVSLVRLVQ